MCCNIYMGFLLFYYVNPFVFHSFVAVAFNEDEYFDNVYVPVKDVESSSGYLEAEPITETGRNHTNQNIGQELDQKNVARYLIRNLVKESNLNFSKCGQNDELNKIYPKLTQTDAAQLDDSINLEDNKNKDNVGKFIENDNDGGNFRYLYDEKVIGAEDTGGTSNYGVQEAYYTGNNARKYNAEYLANENDFNPQYFPVRDDVANPNYVGVAEAMYDDGNDGLILYSDEDDHFRTLDGNNVGNSYVNDYTAMTQTEVLDHFVSSEYNNQNSFYNNGEQNIFDNENDYKNEGFYEKENQISSKTTMEFKKSTNEDLLINFREQRPINMVPVNDPASYSSRPTKSYWFTSRLKPTFEAHEFRFGDILDKREQNTGFHNKGDHRIKHKRPSQYDSEIGKLKFNDKYADPMYLPPLAKSQQNRQEERQKDSYKQLESSKTYSPIGLNQRISGSLKSRQENSKSHSQNLLTFQHLQPHQPQNKDQNSENDEASLINLESKQKQELSHNSPEEGDIPTIPKDLFFGNKRLDNIKNPEIDSPFPEGLFFGNKRLEVRDQGAQ